MRRGVGRQASDGLYVHKLLYWPFWPFYDFSPLLLALWPLWWREGWLSLGGSVEEVVPRPRLAAWPRARTWNAAAERAGEGGHSICGTYGKWESGVLCKLACV